MPPPLDINQGMFDCIVEGPYPDGDYSPRGNKHMFDTASTMTSTRRLGRTRRNSQSIRTFEMRQ